MLGIDGSVLATQMKYAMQFVHMGYHVMKMEKQTSHSDLPWYLQNN